MEEICVCARPYAYVCLQSNNSLYIKLLQTINITKIFSLFSLDILGLKKRKKMQLLEVFHKAHLCSEV